MTPRRTAARLRSTPLRQKGGHNFSTILPAKGSRFEAACRGMPRPLRVQYPGAIDHVMSRANGQGDVFHNGVDRQGFLQTLAEAKAERIIGQSLQRLHLGAWQSLNNQLYLRHTRK